MNAENKPEKPLDLPPVIRVTPEEAGKAVPLPPRPRYHHSLPPLPPRALERPRVSRLAITTLVLGLLPVTPVPGVLALVMGALAIHAIRNDPLLRGTRLAVIGMILGALGMAAWGFGIWSIYR